MVENPAESKPKYQLLSKLNETLSIDDIRAKILDTPVALPLSELLSVSRDLSTFIHEQTWKRCIPVEQSRSQTVATVSTSAPSIIRARVNNISGGEASFYTCPCGRVTVKQQLITLSRLKFCSTMGWKSILCRSAHLTA